VIPTFSSWFEFNKIHQLERDSLPEFFEGRNMKTPEYYMKIRNYMLELYRQNPRAYLTATICRKNISGDACAIIRIHAFLEHWGLINFNFDSWGHNYNTISSKSHQCPDPQGSKLDVLAQERALFEKSDPDQYFDTIQSVSKKVRPVCNACGYVCGFTWYYKEGQPEKAAAKGMENSYLYNTNLTNLPNAGGLDLINAKNQDPLLHSKSSIPNDISYPRNYIPQNYTALSNPDPNSSLLINQQIIPAATYLPPDLPAESPEDPDAKPPTPIIKLTICGQCFNSKNYPTIYAESDFKKSDLETHLAKFTEKSSEWSNSETCELLNQVKNLGFNGENAKALFGKFPDRTREEVVYHF
jgi:hypothetical protein